MNRAFVVDEVGREDGWVLSCEGDAAFDAERKEGGGIALCVEGALRNHGGAGGIGVCGVRMWW